MTTQKQAITALVYDRRGRILSVGRNSYHKTHPLQAQAAKAVGLEHKIYLHAEIDALVRVKDWSRAHRIVITRFTKNGEPANAKPCPVCERVIRQAGIKFVEHT
jgi:deoxycytidylate deaminase